MSWCAGSNYPLLTSKERDNETNLDYAQARYYASTQGRFTSVDPLRASARTVILNNGNVRSQTITVPTIPGITGLTSTQIYTYDVLNRLETAQENSGTSWTQNFSYDPHGNRNFISGTTNPASLDASNNPIINPNNNRIDVAASGQTVYTYDGAGNVTHDVSGHSFAYDAENKQTTYDGGASANGGATYYYDGDGKRVKKVVGGPTMLTTVFVYDIVGHLVAEYSNASLTGPGGTSYLTSDTLGSPRVITGLNQEVRARHDYLPFGEELHADTGGRTTGQGYTGDSVRQKFTLKERDNETKLDYFLARYYSSTQGRFTSPDEFKGGPDELWVLGSGDEQKQALPYADISNPQSLNKYQYGYNNPLRYVDPDGHDVWESLKSFGQGVVGGAKVVANTLMEGSPLVAVPNGVSKILTGEPLIAPFEATDDYRLVHMGDMLKKDDTLRSIADLPPGWSAWRNDIDSEWERYHDKDA